MTDDDTATRLIKSPKSDPPQSPLNSSISSNHGPLTSDIQARIMAFQQKRANKPSHSSNNSPPGSLVLPNFGELTQTNSVPNIGPHSAASNSLEKSLPPLPGHRSLSQNDAGHASLIPSPLVETALKRDYTGPNPPSALHDSLARLQLSPEKQTEFELSKKPSLSQRRGMKLTIGDLGLGSNPSTPPESKSDGSISSPNGDSSSGMLRKGSMKKKPNFKLNLGDLSDSNTTPGSIPSSASSQDGSEDPASRKPQLQGLFANYSKYVDIKSGSLNFSGKASLHSKGVDFSSGSSFRISLDELEFLEEIGHGNYGTVSKVLHKPTGVLMAMKEVRLELDETKFTQILMELEILHKCDSPYIVDFYGAFFVEGAVYMCIEYMDGSSLDKIYTKGSGFHDEASLAYITECVIRGLKELKDVHNIIHRDIKPTNILINTLGKVKLCDFGVSGNLVASLAKTNIGCQSYMAPERIKSANPDDSTYSTQSDVWSLGLTILEVAAGCYPYPSETYDNIFSQLSAIVDGEPPKLDPKRFSKEAQLFVKSCLNKNPDKRPSYAALLNHPWLLKYRDVDPHMGDIVKARVEERSASLSRSNSSKKAPSVASASKKVPGPFTKATPVIGNPSSRENVHSLLKGKVSAPPAHRGGIPGSNRRVR